MVQQSTKTILGQYTAVTIVQDRAKLDHSIAQIMEEQLKEYPVKILSIQLEDVNFSKNYESIIEQTAQKKQEVETARNELQKVQIESQKQVAQAEAENKAIKLRLTPRPTGSPSRPRLRQTQSSSRATRSGTTRSLSISPSQRSGTAACRRLLSRQARAAAPLFPSSISGRAAPPRATDHGRRGGLFLSA